jgi:acetyl esterase
MPLDPQAKDFLELVNTFRGPRFEEMPLAEARKAYLGLRSLAGPPDRVASVEDRTIDGGLRVRVYRPDAGATRPALVYFHGGGWVMGSRDVVDAPCRRLANLAGCVVVSVDYRLAPEHRFPTPVEDCFTATKHLAENAGAFGADPQRVAVGGDSAGGNLAAAVALMARDRGLPPIAFQLLVYPATDCSLDTPSYRDHGEAYALTRAAMAYYWDQYLAGPDDRLNPYACPLRARDLRGLPPALVITAEFDPLRDEGEAYAERLRAVGVAAVAHRYDGMIHGFAHMAAHLDQGAQALRDAAFALRDALGVGPP